MAVAYITDDATNDVYVIKTTNVNGGALTAAVTWTKLNPMQGQQSLVAQALNLAPFRKSYSVTMAYVANNGSHDLLVTTPSDGIHWTGSANVGTQTSKAAPALGILLVQ